MAYATSMRHLPRLTRKQRAESIDRQWNDYAAKVRPVGLTLAEAMAAARVLMAHGETIEVRSALRKLGDWISRFKPNMLECLHCSAIWRSTLPRGQCPKRCQLCGGYAELGGETMILPAPQGTLL